jgi:hypothetical protein
MTPATIENAAASLSLAEGTVRRNIVSTLVGNLVFSGTQWLITRGRSCSGLGSTCNY